MSRANFLSLLGVTPAVGRDFAASDADRGAPAVAILTHELWQRAFGGNLAIVGSTITITGTTVTIVGVAPAGFRFPAAGALLGDENADRHAAGCSSRRER